MMRGCFSVNPLESTATGLCTWQVLRTRLTVAAGCAALVLFSFAEARAAKPGGLLNRKAATEATPQATPQTAPQTAPQAATAAGTSAPAAAPAPALARPAYQVAERSEAALAASVAPLVPGHPSEHPLMPALRWAYSGIGNIEKLQDYSAKLAKRERIGGKLLDYEYMFIKVRHQPFSVYMLFLGPPELKGQEVLYVQGTNDDKMWAHGVGLQKTMFGTVAIKPDGPIAMRNQRYPLTELGILNMTRRLVEVAEQDVKYGECDVKF